ncbi:MAG: GCN5-related N-acetyltransferase [uncultured bacterium]|nr:MAG: GCN5-related N-acetyltransferase [uncultured bacterium]
MSEKYARLNNNFDKINIMIFREIKDKDIAELFVVRTATDENNLSIHELRCAGITEASVKDRLHTNFKGWLCEKNGKIIGFSMGDGHTGEMWVIAVLPEHINQGIGSKLLKLVEEWLFGKGHRVLWLETDVNPKLRAYTFYKKHGWEDKEIKDGSRYMVKTRT